MRVRILSRRDFGNLMDEYNINDDTVNLWGKYAFICIRGNHTEEPKFHFQGTPHDINKSNVFNITFDDLTDKDELNNDSILFKESHAKRIIDFVERNKDKENILVQCYAGVSRSGAVGSFINDKYGSEEYDTFMRYNPKIKPNYYIKSILNKVLREKENERDSSSK